MRTKLGIVVASLAFLYLAVPVAAHHSFTLDYDTNKQISVKGVVSKVEWTNPHPQVYIDVTDAKGTVTTWNFQLMGNRSTLTRAGWTGKTLKIGDQVTIEAYGARTEVPRGIARSVVLADGRSLFAGEASDTYK